MLKIFIFNLYCNIHVNHQLYWVVLEVILRLHENWPLWNQILVLPLWSCPLAKVSTVIFLCHYFLFSFSVLHFPMQNLRPFSDHLLIPELSRELNVLKIFNLKPTFGFSQWHVKPLRSVQKWSTLFFKDSWRDAFREIIRLWRRICSSPGKTLTE